ncbi:hypothetical protein ONZ45_g8617 [Pleurotus djamor]|nr:hypothetical protein ONZ45_g8617 [Pleurotus djamor]
MSSSEGARASSTNTAPTASQGPPAEVPPAVTAPAVTAPAVTAPAAATTPPTTTTDEWDLTKPLTRNWAKGARLEYLDDNLDKFIESLNHGRDASRALLDSVVNGYFSIFDWRLPLTAEPDPANPPDPRERLTQAETTRKGLVISKMRTAIHNWLYYRASKISNPYKHLKSLSPTDPFAVLLSRLTGIGLKPPNCIAGWQELQREKFADYKDAFDAQCAQKKTPKSHVATARNKYMKAIFDGLGEEQKKEWEERAKARHDEEVRQRNAKFEHLDSLSPQDRQDALRRLADFFLPIIEGASAVLGMHVSVFVGGPEPAQGGALNVLSIHSGVNRAAIPMTWGEANPNTFDEVTANFLSYLETCYSAEDREAAALPQTFNSSSVSTTRIVPPRRTEADRHGMHGDSMQQPPQKSKGRRTEASKNDNSNGSPRPSQRSKAPARRQRHRADDSDSDSESESDDHSIASSSDASGRNSRHKPRHQASKRRRSPVTPKKKHGHKRNKHRNHRDAHDEAIDDVDESDERPPLKKSRPRPKRKPQADTPDNDYFHDSDSSPQTTTARDAQTPDHTPAPVDTFACPTATSTRIPVSLKAPEVSSLWPSWFAVNYKVLFELWKMPIVWSTLLATYVELERQTAFDNPGPQSSLSAEKRPGEIQWWIHRGRRQPVVISNVDTFSTEWWSWWKSMQPEWREVHDVDGSLTVKNRVFDLAISEVPDAWSTMDKHGANGFLSVVASLGWWGSHLAKMYPRWNCWTMADPHGHCWDDAAVDVIWVMQRLSASRDNRLHQ